MGGAGIEARYRHGTAAGDRSRPLVSGSVWLAPLVWRGALVLAVGHGGRAQRQECGRRAGLASEPRDRRGVGDSGQGPGGKGTLTWVSSLQLAL